MARAKSIEFSFSSSRGENIYLSEDQREASWFPRHSGNYIYASGHIKPNETYFIEVEGSGHVDIGIVTVNPETISCERRHPSFRRMNEVKVHRRTFIVSVRSEKNEITSKYNEEEYRIKLEADTSAWIAIYPRFGEINAKIKHDEPVLLSRTCGHNIRLDEVDTKAFTIKKCPAAICFPTMKLRPKQQAAFLCTSISDRDKKPSRFHLRIMAHRNDPKDLLKDFKGTFDTSVKSLSEPPWTYIDLLDRSDCEGKITLTLTDGDSVTCSTDNGYEKRMSLPFDGSDGVWLIFELYRVSLKLLDVSSVLQKGCVKEEAGASGGGRDDISRGDRDEQYKFNPENNLPNNAYLSVTYNQARCRPEIQLPCTLETQEYGAAGMSADCHTLRRIENSLGEIHKKLDTGCRIIRSEDNSLGPLSPPANPVQLNFKRNFTALMKEFDARDLMDYFFQESIISKNTYDEIRFAKTPDEANRLLLCDLLEKTVDRAIFETALRHAGNPHLIPLFFPDDAPKK